MGNFTAFGKPMYIESYSEGERLALAQEKLSEIIMDDISNNPDLFADFMLDLHESKDFIQYAKLLRDMTMDNEIYLDKSIEFREFMRFRVENYAEKLARQQLIER